MWNIIKLSEDKDVEVVKTKRLTYKNIQKLSKEFCGLSYDIRKHLESLQNPFILYRVSYCNKILFTMIFEIKLENPINENCVSTFYTENHFMSNIILSNELQQKIINNFIRYKNAYK
jgi:hypothetical protein